MKTDQLQIDIEQRLASAEPEVEVLVVEPVGSERLRLDVTSVGGGILGNYVSVAALQH